MSVRSKPTCRANYIIEACQTTGSVACLHVFCTFMNGTFLSRFPRVVLLLGAFSAFKGGTSESCNAFFTFRYNPSFRTTIRVGALFEADWLRFCAVHCPAEVVCPVGRLCTNATFLFIPVQVIPVFQPSKKVKFFAVGYRYCWIQCMRRAFSWFQCFRKNIDMV